MIVSRLQSYEVIFYLVWKVRVNMSVNELMNSGGMWIACSIMIIVVLVQSTLFLKNGLKVAPSLGLTKKQTTAGMRAAMITAIGPSLSPIIVLLSLVAVLGGPNAWMRMNDVGAARTELAMSDLAVNVLNGSITNGVGLTDTQFAAAIWGMALNNVAWIIIALILSSRMGKVIQKLEAKYNPIWIKMLMAGSTFGLFSYLLGNQVVNTSMGHIASAIASGLCMFLIGRLLSKHQRLQELGLGISLVVGMTVGAIVMS